MLVHCQKPTVVLVLLTILIHVCSTLSQVTEICSAPPSEPVISYNFDVVDSTSYNVCPTSAVSQGVWVFRPASNTPLDAVRGNYTVSGTDLRRCVYNASSSERLQLVVTPPTGQESGDFSVTFVSQTGSAVALMVSYVPRGFYREVNDSIVQGMSFTEPLWRAIGFELGGFNICQQNGSGMLEDVLFLGTDSQPVDASTCLRGDGTQNPLYISLGIREDVEVPNDLIGETLSIVLVTRSCQDPNILSDPVKIGIPTVPTTSSPGGNNTGLIVGVTIGVVLLLVVILSVVLGLVFGFLHLNKIRNNSRSRRASRASLSRQSSTEKDKQPSIESIDLEHEPRNRGLKQYSPPSAPLRASPPVEHTNSGGNFIVVVTPFVKVAEYLASKHGLSLQPLTTTEQTRILNGYSHQVSSALADDRCQFVYFIWNCSLEETSWVSLSDLVRELSSRPLPSTELKKVIFVQLGSKSTYPLSVNILQFALEVSPSSDNFNPQECARLIYDKVQKEVDSDAVDGVVHRTARTVENEVSPTDTSSPLYHSLQSPPPPPYSAVNHDDPRTRSLPPSVERTRATERLHTNAPSSADSSPLIGILETSKELLKEFRGFRSTQEQAAEKEAAKSEKTIKLLEEEAARSEKRTELDEKRTGLMEQEATRSEQRNEKLVVAISEVDANVKQVGDDVQNLGDRLDEVTLEDEPKTNSFST